MDATWVGFVLAGAAVWLLVLISNWAERCMKRIEATNYLLGKLLEQQQKAGTDLMGLTYEAREMVRILKAEEAQRSARHK